MNSPGTTSSERGIRGWSEAYRSQLLKHPSLSYGAWVLILIRGVLRKVIGPKGLIRNEQLTGLRNGLLVISARLIEERVRRESYQKMIRDRILHRLISDRGGLRNRRRAKKPGKGLRQGWVDEESRFSLY